MTGGSKAPLLEARLLDAFYGRVQALHTVSMVVNEGEIVGVIGANGAGKTTLLNAIMGLVPLASGHVDFLGRRITGLPVESMVKLGIGYVPEGRQLFGSLSVRDNLLLGAYCRYASASGSRLSRWLGLLRSGSDTARLERVCETFPILTERLSQTAGSMSGGEQQMLAIARALMSDPKLLLLDEPSVGLSPAKSKEVFRLIDRLRAGGLTVVLVEQNAGAAMRLADRIYVLEGGRVALEGTASEMANDGRVQAAYLGKERS